LATAPQFFLIESKVVGHDIISTNSKNLQLLLCIWDSKVIVNNYQ
jgi:hypothetical protein